jgi:hypothetical protein
MHKSSTKCNETIGKWCKNKYGASKIIDTLETYQTPNSTAKNHKVDLEKQYPIKLYHSIEGKAKGNKRIIW